MSRILILGGTGMLGHALWRACRERHEARATIRAQSPAAAGAALEDPAAVVCGVRAEAPETVQRALEQARPQVVVNCIGIVKQAPDAADAARLVRVNALFPHELAAACAARGVRLIHISTDCVFSGRRGAYTESDIPDPVDAYGRSKLAGEPSEVDSVLVLRASMIGWELAGRRQGLLEWFVAQRGPVRGYTRAVFSGPTAPALSRAILAAIERRPDLSGTWHVAAAPIAKHELLWLLRAALGLQTEIAPDDGPVIDRSLDGSAFSAATGWTAPPWPQLVAELAAGAPARAVADAVGNTVA